MVIKLNNEQESAYKYICDGFNVFITGGGGVGKSALLNYYIKLNKKKKFELAVTSTTGTSATLINGTTLHSYLGLGLGKKSIDATCEKIISNKYLKRKWDKLSILIIDEISMLSADFFDKLENVSRIVRKSNAPFGGIQLILSGDFCQLSPIDSKNFCFEAKSWSNCINKIIYLTKIIRQENILFQNCLSSIRLGTITDNTENLISSRINIKLENDYGIEPTKLFSTNNLVDSINTNYLNKLCQKNKKFSYKLDTTFDEKLKNIYKKCISVSEIVELCIGCQVMLTYNLDIENKLINGSRGVVTNFTFKDGIFIPKVKFLNGIEIDVNFNVWEIEKDDEIIGTFTQIPLKLAYALSIHKSQGCSLDYAIVDLSNLFDYGMGYVALSRIRNLEGLSIIAINWNKIKCNPKAFNFYNNL